ncbi:hypothetical protein QF001_006359 [Paraburkholderia youngii]
MRFRLRGFRLRGFRLRIHQLIFPIGDSYLKNAKRLAVKRASLDK